MKIWEFNHSSTYKRCLCNPLLATFKGLSSKLNKKIPAYWCEVVVTGCAGIAAGLVGWVVMEVELDTPVEGLVLLVIVVEELVAVFVLVVEVVEVAVGVFEDEFVLDALGLNPEDTFWVAGAPPITLSP